MEENIRDAVESAVFAAFVYEEPDKCWKVSDNISIGYYDFNEWGDSDWENFGIRVYDYDLDFGDGPAYEDFKLGDYVRISLGEMLYFGAKEFINDIVDDIMWKCFGIKKEVVEFDEELGF